MKSKLGQNFLIDINTAKREVEYAEINKRDIVLEIGPGKGILTKLLAEKAKKVIAVEIDKKLVEYLKDIMPDNIEIINNDILKVDLEDIAGFNKIVSNIPYQISSPFIFKIMDYNFDSAVLILQKEFAQRLVAEPNDKNYSRLSVSVFYEAYCHLLETVPKTRFKPQPKVDSAMVKIIPRKYKPFELTDKEFFLKLTRDLFSNRRKKIKTIIKNKYKIYGEKLPFLDYRVEELSPKEIGILSNKLKKIL
jgi:16S rRNA (adenine1518-N6/adenine1519-N6)-dimethyltransferase